MIVPRPFFKTSLPGLSMRLLICLFVLTAASLQMTSAQSQGNKEAQKKQDETVKLETRLVTLDVIVKDKKGKRVTDLKAEDFSVFEDGVAQKVEFFSPPLDSGDDASQPNSVAPAPPGVFNGEPTNIISLVLDGATTDPINFKQVREATLKYIQERITGADTVGMFSIANDLQLLQPFTRDKAKLIAAVEKGAALPVSNKNLERGQLAEGIAETRAKLDRLGGADGSQ